MNKIQFIFLFLIITGFAQPILAQNTEVAKIAGFRKLTIDAKDNQTKFLHNDSLQYYLHKFLGKENSFSTHLNNIQYLGDLYSPDGEIRIITWNISLNDGTHDYFCYIQKKPISNEGSKWYELTDNHKQIDRPDYKSLKKENWYGCLYYSIIPFKSDKKIMYALLGWEGHNNYSTKKLIDVLSFSNRGEPAFGKAIFVDEKHTKRRVVFEYSKEAYLLLRYNEDTKQIIFNRLEPPKPELEGVYSFYTPSLFYDAFELSKGKWVLHKDINPKNGKTNKVYHDPTKAPKPPKK